MKKGVLVSYLLNTWVTPFSAHCISAHPISDQKVRTVVVRAIVRDRDMLGDAVVRNAVGIKVGNEYITVIKNIPFLDCSLTRCISISITNYTIQMIFLALPKEEKNSILLLINKLSDQYK